jgi:hypothetical protein
MSPYRFLSTSTVAFAASASNSAALSKYSATLRTLPSSFRGAQTGRLQPLVDMRGGLGLPGLTFEVMPLLPGGSFSASARKRSREDGVSAIGVLMTDSCRRTLR